ncbi:unnamed protein product [Candidula unifasciata]|uniref:Cation efflux protein cytoplasmic domain-containing protein n=1 Tax=Candidula unifasciata TaxID=100452 RepID=A0A8S4AEP8_9EUPU|nr:unnamed protein product [Candidula unifasciata]
MAEKKSDSVHFDLTLSTQPDHSELVSQKDESTSFSGKEFDDIRHTSSDNYKEENEIDKLGPNDSQDASNSGKFSQSGDSSTSAPAHLDTPARKSRKENKRKVKDSTSQNTQNHHGNGVLPNKQADDEAAEITALVDRATKKLRNLRMKELSGHHSMSLTGEEADWKLPLTIFTSRRQEHLDDKPKRVRSFYEKQNDLISAYETLALGIEPADAEIQSLNLQSTSDKALLYSKITLLVNVVLLIAKAVASVLSGSISIISSLVDSCLDLFSGITMWWATRSVRKRDPYNYPQGRTKLEPVAVMVVAVVMGLCSMQLIREAIEMIISLLGDNATLPNVDYITFIIAGSTVVAKLILWLFCRRVNSPIVQALAQDHRNDVLSNAVAIICGYLGSSNFLEITDEYAFSYTDPTGAILICLYIIYNWWQTGSEQIKMLTGHTAKPDFLSQLTWVCINHHPKIKHIDTVRAFHFGNNFLVEVDIVLPEKMTLEEAHNIGETLQQRIEGMSEVERAFVHLDYEFRHNPQTEHKTV